MELLVRFIKDSLTISGSHRAGETEKLPHYEALRLAKEGMVEILNTLPRGETFGWVAGMVGNPMIR